MFARLKADCHRPQEYQRAVQVAPLKVPAGLDTPNTQGALVIPTVELAPPPPGPQRRLPGRAAPLQAGAAEQGGERLGPSERSPDLIGRAASGTLAARVRRMVSSGEVAEWSKALAWKVSNILKGVRGFESLPLRHFTPVYGGSRLHLRDDWSRTPSGPEGSSGRGFKSGAEV